MKTKFSFELMSQIIDGSKTAIDESNDHMLRTQSSTIIDFDLWKPTGQWETDRWSFYSNTQQLNTALYLV